MSPQRAKKEFSSSGYMDALAFLQWEWNEPRWEKWYLAQIAKEVWNKQNDNKRTTKEMLIDFEHPDPSKPKQEADEEEDWQTRRAHTLAALGLSVAAKRQQGKP